MKLLVRFCCWLLFFFYLLILVKYLVLDRIHFGGYFYRSYNLIPFKSINQYVNNKEHYNYNTWFMNLMGNLMMLVPLGVVLPILFDFFRTFRNFLVVLISINMLIEIFQYILVLGSLDIDDVIMNSFGALTFYLITQGLLKIKFLKKLFIEV